MKQINFTSRCKDDILCIKTDLGTISIKIGLIDAMDRKVEIINAIPGSNVKAVPVWSIRLTQLKGKRGKS